jgi:hypothetical protein
MGIATKTVITGLRSEGLLFMAKMPTNKEISQPTVIGSPSVVMNI